MAFFNYSRVSEPLARESYLRAARVTGRARAAPSEPGPVHIEYKHVEYDKQYQHSSGDLDPVSYTAHEDVLITVFLRCGKPDRHH